MKKKPIVMTVMVALCGMAQAAMVTIGNAGNAADGSTGYGAVAYTYQISATEVTIAEFQAATGAGNGNENYWNTGGKTVGTNAPAVNVNAYEAMKYCNWLTSGNVDSGYYTNMGGGVYQANALSHIQYATANGLTYFLPTEDEWYKAAYFKPDATGYSLYANGTGTQPAGIDANYTNLTAGAWAAGTGAVEQNGTYEMMGNVWDWMETSAGVIRGGHYYVTPTAMASSSRSSLGTLGVEDYSIGFRVVSVVAIPEPATAISLVLGGLVITGYRRMRKSYGHF